MSHSCSHTRILQVGGSGSGITDLSFIASPTVGVVASNTGVDATIPLATTINSGLMSPEHVAALSATTATNAQIGVGNTYIQVVDPITGAINFVVDGVVEMTIAAGKITIPNILDPKAYIGSPQTIAQRDTLTATTGMLVWVVDGATKEWQYYDGTAWKSISSSEAVQFASSAEVTAGVVTDKIVAPDTLKVELNKKVNKPIASTQGFIATVNATGDDVEYIAAAPTASPSTQVEVTAGTAVANKYVQPDTLKVELDKKLDDIQLIDDDTFLTATSTNIPSAESTKSYVDGKVTVINDTLVSTSLTEALSANQGKVLQDTKVNKPTLLADAGKMLIVNATGTDVEYAVVDADEVIESTIALTGAAPVGAKYGINTVTGLTYYVSGGNWVASPVSTVDLNTTISDETGVNGTGLLVPSTPPAGTPDIGDLHIEIYDDVKIYFTATANDWLTPTVIETQIDQRTSIFAWGANTSYTIGDLVTAESRTYRRITNGTSPASFTLDRSNWEVIVPLQAISPWSAATYYYEGETLNVHGRVFRCNTSHTSNGGNFGVDELTNWDRVDNISSSLDYQGNFYYYQGEQITNNKKIYRRIAAGASSLLFDVTEQTNWELVGGGEVNVVTESQTKTAHSFVVGDVIYNDGTTWLKASAALGTSIGQAVVSQVIDVNSFKVVYSGILTATAHGKTVGNYYFLDQTVAGTTIITQPTTGIVQQIYFVKDANTLLVDISNAFIAVATTPDVPLTYGRVRANLDLASTTHINTDPGTKIPFTLSTYLSGMTDNAGSLIPSISGRYRADWLCMASSTDFEADGIFHVVQNGVSVGQTSYNMNQASAVNQCAGFIDVDLVAGQEVSLHYRTRHTASDGIAWDRGSYFQLTQLPTAVAPIVEYVAENGSLNLASNVTIPPASISPATGVDVLSFTLPSAGTWNVTALLKAFISAGTNSNVVTGIFDSLDTLVVGSDIIIGMVNTNSEQHTGTSNVIITTTAAATYTIKAWNTFGFGGSINAAPNGATGIRWVKIAGQLPSTGQTVDFLYAQLTSDAAIGNGGTFQFTTQSGTLTNASGVVTLPAGKTFYYSAKVGKANLDGAAGFAFQFRNLATNTLTGSRGQAVPPSGVTNEAASSVAWGVITTGGTPVNIRLENTEGGTRTAINGQTSLYIVQIGSTATTGTPSTLDRTDIQGISSSTLTDMFTYSGEIDVEYDTPRSAATALQFTSINASSSGITVGTNTINITKTAFYRIQIQESIQTAPGSYMQIVKNGNTILAVSFTDYTATVISRSALWGGELFAGDVIDIRHGRTANAGNDGVKSFNIHIAQVN